MSYHHSNLSGALTFSGGLQTKQLAPPAPVVGGGVPVSFSASDLQPKQSAPSAPVVDGGVPAPFVTALADYLLAVYASGGRNPDMVPIFIAGTVLKRARPNSRGTIDSSKVAEALRLMDLRLRDFISGGITLYFQGSGTRSSSTIRTGSAILGFSAPPAVPAEILRGVTIAGVLGDIVRGKYALAAPTKFTSVNSRPFDLFARTPVLPPVLPPSPPPPPFVDPIHEPTFDTREPTFDTQNAPPLEPYTGPPLEPYRHNPAISEPGAPLGLSKKHLAIAAVGVGTIVAVGYAMSRKRVVANRRKH